jgi:hypothetical protein
MFGGINRRSSSTIPISASNLEATNYKEMYLECKRNVALFMKQVDQ